MASHLRIACDARGVRYAAPSIAIVVASCGRDKAPLPPAPSAAETTPVATPLATPLATIERALHVDAGELEPTVDPPAQAGDLKAELDQFTTLDACVQHARVDPLVADALEGFGYDTFLRDACRVLDAARTHDGKRCDPIDASTLRAHCHAIVAEIAGDADACPWKIAAEPRRGRDPACVAIAARDPRLCAAAEGTTERATCDAIASHDAASCNRLAARVLQGRCRRDAERWHAATPAPDSRAKPLPMPVGALHIEGGGEASAGPIDADLAQDVAHGVVVVVRDDGIHVVLGALSEGGLGLVTPLALAHARATIALDVFVATAPTSKHAAPVEGRIERGELRIPAHAPLSIPGAITTLVPTIATLEPVRGGEVKLSIDGDIGDSVATWRVHMEATTFVRDRVEAGTPYGGRPPLLATDGGMR
jgi:hypothetical protein